MERKESIEIIREMMRQRCQQDREFEALSEALDALNHRGETIECKVIEDRDSHGADYGIRKIEIRVPDFTPAGTKYLVNIHKK